MSIQTCGRDQRKMMQVIDQIKVLVNNLDDLREEISSLRNNYLPNNERNSASTKMEATQLNVLHKLGKSIKAIAPTNLPGAWKRPTKEPEICFHRPNSDASIFSSLKYMFRFGKRKKAVEMVTCLKKDDSSQTDQTFDKSSSRSINRSTFSQKQLKRLARFSEISCEFDSQAIDPLADIFIVQTQNNARGKELCLLDDDKHFTTVCTQTSLKKPKRKRLNFNFHSKNPNFYFSKIKNAVIAKKIVGNPSENALTVCGRIIRGNCPRSSKQFYENYPYRTRKRDNNVDAIAHENSCSLINNVESLKNKFSITEQNVTEYSSTEGESEGATSTASICLSLGVDVSDSSSQLEEFYSQRKPRTYTIRKPSRNYNENSRHERIVDAGATSDLTLSSHSFSS